MKPTKLPKSRNTDAEPEIPGTTTVPPDAPRSTSISSNAPGSAGVSPAKGWYSRNYLPHCDVPGLIQAITFRLADALPKEVIARLDSEPTDDIVKCRKIEAFLDAGHGQCWLRQPPIAQIVEQALLHFDGQRYHLLAWCIMPNHVHTLIEPFDQWSLSSIVHSWKSYTAKEINKVLQRTGTVWQREYYDRYIRDDSHLAAVINYIHENPVKAGLVDKPWQWPYSSARLLAGETPALPTCDNHQARNGLD